MKTQTAYPSRILRWVSPFCYLEGGMHDHMTLHALSNPLPSRSRPSDASERSGGCRCLLRQGKKWRLP